MEKKSLLKLVAICVTVLICVSIASYSYYESNRYVLNGGGAMVDKYKGIIYLPDGRRLNYDLTE